MHPKGKYEKPEITRITLRPEEATLSSCKAGGAGPSQTRCGPRSLCLLNAAS